MHPFGPYRFVNIAAIAPAAGGGYTRTAFVNSSYGGVSELNNPSKPFQSGNAAIAALAADDLMTPCTVIWTTAGGGWDFVSNPNLNDLLLVGITLQGSSPGMAVDSISFGSQPSAKLTLINVTVALITKEPHAVAFGESAGTITSDGSASITHVVLDSTSTTPDEQPKAGDGTPYTGMKGADGAAGDPPGNGDKGETAYANGDGGATGTGSAYAWSCSFVGTGYVDAIDASAIAKAGKGGRGGDASTAVGGNGGTGGYNFAGQGGTGGDGGDAYANGGDGGDGGVGGKGGDIYIGGWTYRLYNLNGASGGDGGDGGNSGTATPGAGGAAGDGASMGGPGNYGNAYANNGNTGFPGSNGSGGIFS